MIEEGEYNVSGHVTVWLRHLHPFPRIFSTHFYYWIFVPFLSITYTLATLKLKGGKRKTKTTQTQNENG